MRIPLRRIVGALVLAGLLFQVQPQIVQAQMVWEDPLSDLSDSILGPTVASAFLIAVVIFGVMWWFGFSMISSGVGLLIGGAIAANADTIADWLGFDSGGV